MAFKNDEQRRAVMAALKAYGKKGGKKKPPGKMSEKDKERMKKLLEGYKKKGVGKQNDKWPAKKKPPTPKWKKY